MISLLFVLTYDIIVICTYSNYIIGIILNLYDINLDKMLELMIDN